MFKKKQANVSEEASSEDHPSSLRELEERSSGPSSVQTVTSESFSSAQIPNEHKVN